MRMGIADDDGLPTVVVHDDDGHGHFAELEDSFGTGA
jgi:hypothetical protein